MHVCMYACGIPALLASAIFRRAVKRSFMAMYFLLASLNFLSFSRFFSSTYSTQHPENKKKLKKEKEKKRRREKLSGHFPAFFLAPGDLLYSSVLCRL